MTDATAGEPLARPEPAEEPLYAPEPADRHSTRRWLPWALVVVAAATAVAMTWVAASLDRRLDDEGGADSDVSRVAGQFAQALFTYDYRDLASTREEVLATATGGFRSGYEEAFDTVFEPLITKGKAVSDVTVKDVFVSDDEGGEAEAVVVIDTTSESTKGTRQLSNVYLRLSLVDVDGTWKVADVSYPKAVPPESLGPTGAGTAP